LLFLSDAPPSRHSARTNGRDMQCCRAMCYL
jgi:hypothetical protein